MSEDLTPVIADPFNFLRGPFRGVISGRLVTAPSIPFMQELPILMFEVGLIHFSPSWYMVKASQYGIPTWAMPERAGVLMQSHYFIEAEPLNDGSIPSTSDFYHCSPYARNFVISIKGLTQFWSVERSQRKFLEDAMERNTFKPGSETAYLKFLQKVGARFELYPWETLNEQRFFRLLYA